MSSSPENITEQAAADFGAAQLPVVEPHIRTLVRNERGSVNVLGALGGFGVAVAVAAAFGVITSKGGPGAEGSIAPVVKKAGFENMKVDGRFCFIVVEGKVTVQAPLTLKPNWGPLTAVGEIDKTTVYNAPDQQGNTSPVAYLHTCPKLKDIQMYVDPNAERAFHDVPADAPVVKVEVSADDMETIIEPARIISLTEFVDTNDSFNAADTEARDAYMKLMDSIARYFNGNKQPSQDDLRQSTMLMNFMHSEARETGYLALEIDCMNALRKNKNYIDAAQKIFAYFAAKSFNENHPDEPPISIYDVQVTIKNQTLPADKQALAHMEAIRKQEDDIRKIFADQGVDMKITPFKVGDVKCDINVGTITEQQIRDAVGGWAQDMLPTSVPATPTAEPIKTSEPTPTESGR